MDSKVSGFGFCSAAVGHTGVDIYKDADNRYYVKIDYMRSTKTFSDLNDVKGLWDCVAEVERDLIEIQRLDDRHKGKPGLIPNYATRCAKLAGFVKTPVVSSSLTLRLMSRVGCAVPTQ